ncbi:hypothetical protein GGR56DRAFT_373430 [Xylariaceae sp. FL0804]|nr:hypothetical protein GGR56DRAFT_373430 [Xylariaceae sp. FL0804]
MQRRAMAERWPRISCCGTRHRHADIMSSPSFAASGRLWYGGHVSDRVFVPACPPPLCLKAAQLRSRVVALVMWVATLAEDRRQSCESRWQDCDEYLYVKSCTVEQIVCLALPFSALSPIRVTCFFVFFFNHGVPGENSKKKVRWGGGGGSA